MSYDPWAHQDAEFYERVYRRCLPPWKRMLRFFTHKLNGQRRRKEKPAESDDILTKLE